MNSNESACRNSGHLGMKQVSGMGELLRILPDISEDLHLYVMRLLSIASLVLHNMAFKVLGGGSVQKKR